MSCEHFQSIIDRFLDGALEPKPAAALEAHLAQCAQCARVYENHRALQARLYADPGLRYSAPAELKARLRASLAQGVRAQPATVFARMRINRPWLSVAVFALVIPLVSMSTLWFVRLKGAQVMTQEIVASHVRSLLPGNVLIAVASSDRHTVKPWFAGKLDFSPPVADFAQEDFTLIGGRLDYLAGRTVATLVYRHRLHVITAFIWPKMRSSMAMGSREYQGYNLRYWSDNAMNYWLISDLSGAELSHFEELLRRTPQQ